MDTRIYNLIILDKSGSMQSIRKAAVDNVNETLQTIREAEKRNRNQKHYVTLVTFNDESKTVCDCERCFNVKDIDIKQYQPQCGTALYDTMGKSLNELRQKVSETDKVLVTIITDGYENASIEYSGQAIKALVDELKGLGWVFAYIGANQNVEGFAASISITNTMKFEATEAGTYIMTKSLNRSRNRLYSTMSEPEFNAEKANTDFFEDND